MKANHRLSDLKPGETAVVGDFVHDMADKGVLLRLREMGLIPGTPIELLRFAPFGGPLEIRLRGYCLSLRRHEAAKVTVARQSA